MDFSAKALQHPLVGEGFKADHFDSAFGIKIQTDVVGEVNSTDAALIEDLGKSVLPSKEDQRELTRTAKRIAVCRCIPLGLATRTGDDRL